MILSSILYVVSLAAALGCAYLLSSYNLYLWLMALPFWVAFFYLSFGIWVLILIVWGPFLKNKPTPDKPNRFYIGVIHQTVQTFFLAFHIHVRVRGGSKIPANQKVLYVNNHISNFDPMAMICAFRGPFLGVTKPENLKFPIAGPFIRLAGFIPINREDAKEGSKAINKASEYLRRNLCDVEICPEGTRNKTDQLLLEFHAGSFRAGMDAKAPIAIVAVKGTKEIHKRAPWRPCFVYLDILKVITPEEYEYLTPAQVRDLAFGLIKNDLEGGLLYELPAL